MTNKTNKHSYQGIHVGMKSLHKFAVSALLIGTLSACQTMTNPEHAKVIAAPTTPIVKNLTSFSNSLRCMDDLFLEYGKKNIVITSDGIPDETGQISLGSKEIMISTISKMSAKSNALRFVDVEITGDAVFWIQENWIGTSQITPPGYYIRGSITQVDQGVASDSQGAGFALPFVSLGYSQDQMLALVSIDMNMGNVRNRQIIPGLNTTNTITVVRSGQGGDAEGIIGKGSVYLEVSQDRSQGSHQAVRTLIELSLIEMMGKFTKVPYWRCLEIEATDPNILRQTRDWFDQLTNQERVELTQRSLITTGDYRGRVTGQLDRQLQDAINRYKARSDLLADGRIDFDLYFSLLTNNIAPRPEGGGATQMVSTEPPTSETNNRSGSDPVGLKVVPVNPGGRGISVNDEIRFEVTVDKPADVYCYYAAVGERPARIFPSRFQPTNRLTPGNKVIIPSSTAGFAIKPAKSGEEQIACIATTRPYSNIDRPSILLEQDLSPLSVGEMFGVINAHQEANTLDSSVQQILFRVTPHTS